MTRLRESFQQLVTLGLESGDAALEMFEMLGDGDVVVLRFPVFGHGTRGLGDDCAKFVVGGRVAQYLDLLDGHPQILTKLAQGCGTTGQAMTNQTLLDTRW